MGLGKVELHLHLDGSLDLETAYRLAKERSVIPADYPFESFRERMIVPEENVDLASCLKCFEFPIAIMQDREALEECTYTTIRNLYNMGLIYAEIRFAPQEHCTKGLTQAEVIQAVLDGRNRAARDFPDILVNIICCCMVKGPAQMTEAVNMETIRQTKNFLGKGVVAADLAGWEGACPYIDFKPVFDLARELEVPFTLHAGEAGPAANVATALDMGAKRIGHGVHSVEDPAVMKRMIDLQVPYEVCVTSNIQCHCQPSYEEHSIIELFKNGANVTINSDNMTLSHVDTNSEIEVLMTRMGFTEADIIRTQENAIRAAFVEDAVKDALLKKLHESL